MSLLNSSTISLKVISGVSDNMCVVINPGLFESPQQSCPARVIITSFLNILLCPTHNTALTVFIIKEQKPRKF